MKVLRLIPIVIILTFCLFLTNCRYVAVDKNTDNSQNKYTNVENGLSKETSNIQIIDSANFHFSTIKAGDTVTHVFYFKNIGKVPMIITKVTASCNCTVANFTKYPTAHNKIDSVVAIFISRNGMKGFQNKMITMYYNSLQSPQLFTLYGLVK